MQIKAFNIGEDYPQICDWWRGHGWPYIPVHSLPTTGWVSYDEVERYAAGWLYISNSTTAWSEWIVTNPGSNLRKRSEGVKMLISIIKLEAKSRGVQTIVTSLKSGGLIRAYERQGFVKTDEHMTNLVGRI